MTLAFALHNIAIRYCMERHAYWCEQYSEIVRTRGERQSDGYNYTAEALATFPRYNVLNAIRVELERIDPEKLGDMDSTRDLLILAGQAAEDVFTRPPTGDIQARVMNEEREEFCRFVRALKSSDLDIIEKLPYQRVLTEAEAKSIWAHVRSKWQIKEGFWYPLSDCELPDVLAFDTEAFEKALPQEVLQNILATRGIKRVFELREYGPEYEQDLALFEPSYNGAEGYWISNDLDWIFYASHESSITVGGLILKELKTIWPEWASHLWTGNY
jgi:hypothetical protein